MDKKLFGDLVESMKQMNETVQGKRAFTALRGRCNLFQEASLQTRT